MVEDHYHAKHTFGDFILVSFLSSNASSFSSASQSSSVEEASSSSSSLDFIELYTDKLRYYIFNRMYVSYLQNYIDVQNTYTYK